MKLALPATALAISSYQPTRQSSELLRLALGSIQKFSPQAHTYVFDVGSPKSKWRVDPDEFPDVTFHSTSYIPKSWERTSSRYRAARKVFMMGPPRQGSIANGWTLDWAWEKLQNQGYKFFMTLQMDILLTSERTLPLLVKEAGKPGRFAAGVRRQLNLGKSEPILHSLGCMWNADVLEQLGEKFAPDFPDYDVGEKLSAAASRLGLDFYSLKSMSEARNPDVLTHLNSLFGGRSDAAFDNNEELLFLHLGRGIPKSMRFTKTRDPLANWREAYERYVVREKSHV